MGTALLYIYFLISATLLVLGATYFLRDAMGTPVPGSNGMPTPRWLHGSVFVLGCLGVLSSAPSIFSDNPHWFVDKIYLVASKIIAAFT